MYVTVINQDGSITKSDAKSIVVSEYTDLPEIFKQVFGYENGTYGTTTWTWDENPDNSNGMYWGNGNYGNDTQPAWWGAPTGADINQQASEAGLPNDGLGGWFSLSLNGVNTSRGETGTVSVSEDVAKANWDIGTMTFSGTMPLMGVLPNQGNARQYVYQILRADDEKLYLSFPEPGVSADAGGTGWFLCFKKIENQQ